MVDEQILGYRKKIGTQQFVVRSVSWTPEQVRALEDLQNILSLDLYGDDTKYRVNFSGVVRVAFDTWVLPGLERVKKGETVYLANLRQPEVKQPADLPQDDKKA